MSSISEEVKTRLHSGETLDYKEYFERVDHDSPLFKELGEFEPFKPLNDWIETEHTNDEVKNDLRVFADKFQKALERSNKYYMWLYHTRPPQGFESFHNRLLELFNIHKDNLSKCFELFQKLLDKGADISIVWYGDTLLHEACDERAYKIIRILLNKGLPINAKNGDGETPIILLNNSIIDYWEKDENSEFDEMIKLIDAMELSLMCAEEDRDCYKYELDKIRNNKLKGD